MTEALYDTRNPNVLREQRNLRASMHQFFKKIQEAAYDGQNGSATYAMDRLAVIQSLATAAIAKLDE